MTRAADRRPAAEKLLREVVFRSRARQAAQTFLAQAKPGRGECGLGQEPAIVLDLSAEGAALFQEIWPEAPAPDELARIDARMSAWVVEQDGLDRQRNHYLKAFRHKHGMDRRAYPAEVEAEFERGLEALAREEDAARARAAQALLEPPLPRDSEAPAS